MKKTNRLWLALLLTVLVAALLAAGLTAAAEEPTIIYSGNGLSAPEVPLTWTLDSEGTFRVSGEGQMCDHFLDTTPCWNVGYLVNRVVIEPGCTRIGELIFAPCEHLETVTIPDTVLSIGICAFGTQSPLTDVFFNGSEAQWNAITFEEENTLLLNANIHYNVADWGYCGGEGDGTNLTWVLTNDGTLTISGEGAMKDYIGSSDIPWYALKDSIQTVAVENGVTNIGNSAFIDCSNLTGVTIPDSVTSLGQDVFSCCSSLTAMTIPNTVTNVSFGLFYNCTALRTVSLSKNITSIPDRMFYNCSNLQTVPVTYWMSSIGDAAFSGCTSLKTVSIPWTVNSIGEDAFSECTGMTEIDISPNVKHIGNGAFRGCTAIKSIQLPNGLTDLGDSVFCGCTSLIGLEIPNKLTNISNVLFFNCTALKYVVIPDSVTEVRMAAFAMCTALQDVFYTGSEEQWAHVRIDDEEGLNQWLHDADVHFNVVSGGYCGAEDDGSNLMWILAPTAR